MKRTILYPFSNTRSGGKKGLKFNVTKWKTHQSEEKKNGAAGLTATKKEEASWVYLWGWMQVGFNTSGETSGQRVYDIKLKGG